MGCVNAAYPWSEVHPHLMNSPTVLFSHAASAVWRPRPRGMQDVHDRFDPAEEPKDFPMEIRADDPFKAGCRHLSNKNQDFGGTETFDLGFSPVDRQDRRAAARSPAIAEPSPARGPVYSR
jgi:hypothetical protein